MAITRCITLSLYIPEWLWISIRPVTSSLGHPALTTAADRIPTVWERYTTGGTGESWGHLRTSQVSSGHYLYIYRWYTSLVSNMYKLYVHVFWNLWTFFQYTRQLLLSAWVLVLILYRPMRIAWICRFSRIWIHISRLKKNALRCLRLHQFAQ